MTEKDSKKDSKKRIGKDDAEFNKALGDIVGGKLPEGEHRGPRRDIGPRDS